MIGIKLCHKLCLIVYNYDSIMSNFLFVDSSDDNRINFELSRRNLYNKNIRYNNSRRVSNMNVDDVEAVSNNNLFNK